MRLLACFDLVERHARHLRKNQSASVLNAVSLYRARPTTHLGPSICTLLVFGPDRPTQGVLRRASLEQPRLEPHSDNFLDQELDLLLQLGGEIGKVFGRRACEALDQGPRAVRYVLPRSAPLPSVRETG